MRGKDRKRIADGLYLLAAGSHPVTFMNVLRTYVLQHIQTTEQAVELLTQLRSINEPAFSEALQALGGQSAPAQHHQQRAAEVLKQLDALRAESRDLVATLAGTMAKGRQGQPKKASSRKVHGKLGTARGEKSAQRAGRRLNT